ncbi:MAG: DUF1016 family protein [Cytophagales bacterium]|nr:MAG: DUF1016 family protein [Cytophagales bacterium]
MEIKDNNLYHSISQILVQAKTQIVQTVNTTMVATATYFEIGKMIVKNEQNGAERAGNGKQILIDLSKKLTENFGKSFSAENLDRMRYFYKTYHSKISSSLMTKFELSWTHYITMMRIANVDERSFYEIESKNNNWSIRELER